jgi:acyl-coenzyme A synthetase/AMP-(fatty) acid ligase
VVSHGNYDGEDICPPEPMNAEDPLFILYTSAQQESRKGVAYTGGYLTYVNSTFREVFDLNKMMCSGVLQMWAGLQGILMCFMDHCPMVQPR